MYETCDKSSAPPLEYQFQKDRTHQGISGGLYYWEVSPFVGYLQRLPKAKVEGNDHG